MDVAVLLDEDIIEDVVSDTVHGIGLHDSGAGQRLVVGRIHVVVVELGAAAHLAAGPSGHRWTPPYSAACGGKH